MGHLPGQPSTEPPTKIPSGAGGWRGPAPLFLAAALAALFLPMAWGWHGVPFHLFSPLFTGAGAGARTLPPALRHLPGDDPTGVIMDYPNALSAARRLRSGEIPWWNPDCGMGRPATGSAQVFPFSPLLLPFVALPSPFTYSLKWVLACLLSLWAGRRLLLEAGLDPLPAAAGAALWSASPFVASTMIMGSVEAYWCFPLALLGAHRIARSSGREGWAAAATGFALMVLCGQPETAWMLGILALLFLVPLAGLRAWAVLALSAGLAAVLSAAQWGPVMGVLGESSWYKSLAMPRALGLAHPIGAFFDASSVVFLQPLLWAGALLALAPRERRRETAGLLAGLALMLSYTSPTLSNLPPLRLLRLGGIIPPIHASELAVVPLTLLAVFGLAPLMDERRRPTRRWRVASALVALGFTAWAVASLAPWTTSLWVGPLWLCLLAVLATAWLLDLSPARWTRALPAAVFLAAVLLPAALKEFRYPSFSSSPSPEWKGVASLLDGSGTPRARLWAQAGPRTAAPYLTPNLNLLSGIPDVRSASVLNPPGSLSLARAFGPGGHLGNVLLGWQEATPPLLRFLGVGCVVLGPERSGGPLRLAPMKPGPRAFVVHEIEIAGDEEAARDRFVALLHQGDLLRRAVTGPEAKPPLTPPSIGDPGEPAAEVTWTSYGPERLALRVETPRPGLLVLVESYSRRWRAFVDRSPTPVVRTDVMFRGVPVAAGAHEVTMAYEPGILRWAIGLSAAAWLLLGGWMGIRRRALRRPSQVPPSP